jgi:hypothetical protein
MEIINKSQDTIEKELRYLNIGDLFVFDSDPDTLYMRVESDLPVNVHSEDLIILSLTTSYLTVSSKKAIVKPVTGKLEYSY